MFCILNTYYQVIQFHGFITTSVVCDGASRNISTIGANHDLYGAYLINEQLDDK